MKNNELKLVVAKGQSDLFKVARIRAEVFIIEQNCDPLIEIDEEDQRATHFLLYKGTSPIGCARVIEVNKDEVIIGRLALIKSERGLGNGLYIMGNIETWLKEHNYKRIVLHAQSHAIPFYQKLGYNIEGEEFMEANIKHKMAVKEIAA